MLNDPKLPAEHPLNQLPASLFRDRSEFAPKLNKELRCGVLAAYKSGISVNALAAAFGVNRRTITHIVSPDSHTYRDVREEYARQGHVEFVSLYMTPQVVNMLKSAAKAEEVTMTATEYDASTHTRARVPTKRANGSAGIQFVAKPDWPFAHRIDVQWLDANSANAHTSPDGKPIEHPEGWYTRDLDGEDPDFWYGDPEAHSHLTSSAALLYAKSN